MPEPEEIANPGRSAIILWQGQWITHKPSGVNPLNILLLRPSYTINRYSRSVPLSYLVLGAYLRENGHVPYILDMLFPSVTWETVDECIRENGIEIVGIGCMTCEYHEAVGAAREMKERHPDLPIVFGGAHPTGNPRQCLETGLVDYAVCGEGEEALTALLNAMDNDEVPSGIHGVWFFRKGKMVANGKALAVDLEPLPIPAYDMVDLNAYFAMDPPWHFPESRRVIQFITSRGCPYKCSYCHRLHGKQARLLSAENVLCQMETLHREYGVEEFIIVDDIFNVDLKRAKAICRGIVERELKIHIQLPNGVRGDVFDEELMMLLAKAGTHYLAVAIETATPRLQKLIRKNLKINVALDTVRLAKKYKIEVGGFFMIGFPSETRDEVMASIQLALHNPFDVVFFSIVTPYEGTEIRQDILNGVFGPEAKAALESDPESEFPVIYNDSLTPERLFSIRRKAYLRFYLNPVRMWNLIKKMRHPVYAKQIIVAVFRRLFRNGEVTVT